jgi:hypothetical protein
MTEIFPTIEPGGKVVPAAPQPSPPSGQFNDLLWMQEAAQATNDLRAQGYTQLANDWAKFYPTFHAQHPNYSVDQAKSVFVGKELATGLGKAIPGIGTFVGGSFPNAVGSAAANAAVTNPLNFLGNIADFFHRLTEAQTWLRVGEVVAGLMLIYIALKATMTPGGVPVASRKAGGTFKEAGKKLAKVAILK